MRSPSARPGDAFEALLARLTQAARRIGETQAAERLLARRNDPNRWRRAALLWPLFAKD
jgi:hypothetical protein